MIRIADKPTSIFAFTGRALDKDTAVESHQLRHFDPTVGQWLNEEPIGYQGDGDLHRYVSNRPQ